MIDAEPLREQAILCSDHVDIAVAGKCGVRPVAGLARVAMADSIGQHDEEARRIQSLAWPEQLAGKFRPDEISTVARRAMEDQYGVGNDSVAITSGLAESAIVNPQLRERLSRGEHKSLEGAVTLDRHRVLRGASRGARREDPQDTREKYSQEDCTLMRFSTSCTPGHASTSSSIACRVWASGTEPLSVTMQA